MCLSPTKSTTPAQVQQCRCAGCFFFLLFVFSEPGAVCESSTTPEPCLLLFLSVLFFFSWGKHCCPAAAVLTTWIRSEQNAAWWKTACWREREMFFLNKWLSSSRVLVHGWCCQMGTYCWVLWVLTDLIFPNTGFCCVFCVRNGLAWLLWYGNVTTWEGDGAVIDSQAGQWPAALPSGSRGKDGNQVESGIQVEWKCFIQSISCRMSYFICF